MDFLVIAQIIPTGVMAVVLVWLILVFVSGIMSDFHGAPFVPIPVKAVPELLGFGELLASDVYYDLGSGDGRTLISAVRDFRVQHAVGFEIAPWPYRLSLWRVKRARLGANIQINRGNFFSTDLSGATFIYIYLFPKLVDRLATKFESELKVGTKVLCPSFPIDTAKHPSFSLKKSEKIGTITAYLYVKV